MDYRSLRLKKPTMLPPTSPKTGEKLVPDHILPLLHRRFPKDVRNVIFSCLETADISGRRREG